MIRTVVKTHDLNATYLLLSFQKWGKKKNNGLQSFKSPMALHFFFHTNRETQNDLCTRRTQTQTYMLR